MDKKIKMAKKICAQNGTLCVRDTKFESSL